jgi:hypothetical protein
MSSKFLRVMALSKTPADFRKPESAAKASTVDSLSTVDKLTTVAKVSTVASLAVDVEGNPVDSKLCKPASRVQHGHTPGEHAVYMALWNRGGPPDRKDEFRDVSIGYDKLAALIGGSKRNVQRLAESLIRKLAIQIVRSEDSGTRLGKTYRVFGMAEILKRRKEEGYTYVIRNRSGVNLVKMPFNLSTVDKLTTVDSLSTVTVDSLSTVTVDSLSTPLGSSLGSSLGRPAEPPSSSNDNSSLSTVMSKFGIVLDDDAARRIIRRCQSADHTATVEEIAHFAELKVQQLMKRKNIENWPGMLMAAVPAYFDPPATELTHHRDAKRQEREQEIASWRAILADPASDDEFKQIAMDELGRLGGSL